LIGVQQRMNDMSLEKEQKMELLRDVLLEMYVNLLNKKFQNSFFSNY
jgi:hypothetical protein